MVSTRETERDQAVMDRTYSLEGDAIEGLRAHVAVLDEAGCVIAVNRRWRRYGRQNGATSDYVGMNYLDVCARAARKGDKRSGRVEKGLRRLLSGRTREFGLAYHCGHRTFRLQAGKLREEPARFIVAHEEITALLQVRRDRKTLPSELEAVRPSYLATVTEACEELGQRLAAIGLAAHSLERAGRGGGAVTTIRLAVDEARREVRLLRTRAEQLSLSE
jgi:two-component system NarL family sensor kinase